MKRKLSLYWKCQLIGWGLLFVCEFASNTLLPAFDFQWETVASSIAHFFLGILLTHAMRSVIRAFKVIQFKLLKQIIFVFLITLGFAAIGCFFYGVANFVVAILFRQLPNTLFSGVFLFTLPDFVAATIGLFVVLFIWNLIYLLYHNFKRILKANEEKVTREKQMLELEARALRAQMNPHFIFNCMNSIKALIQNDDKIRSIEYLTTFSKLIRTLFQNSDKRQISLHDELETCMLYLQLETMRLNGKLKYRFTVDGNLDLKSVMVPALIIQPFIENAIWHGIVPKDEGLIELLVTGNQNEITCEVDDDGIGREISKRNKPLTPVVHESKGVRLSQARLNIQKMLYDTNASIRIIDKHNEGEACGTKVILTFNLN